MPFRRLVAATLVMAGCGSTSSSSSSATELLNQALVQLGSVPAMKVSLECQGDCAPGSSDVIVGAGPCGERAWFVAEIKDAFKAGAVRVGERQVNGHDVVRLVPRGSQVENEQQLQSEDELDVAADGAPYPLLWHHPGAKLVDVYTFTPLTSAPASPRYIGNFCAPVPPTPRPSPIPLLAGSLRISVTGSVTLGQQTIPVECDLNAHRVAGYSPDQPIVGGRQMVAIAVGMGRGHTSDAVDLYVLPPNTPPNRSTYYTGPAQLTTRTADPWTGTFTADVTAEPSPTPAAGPSLHVTGDFTCSPRG